VTYAFSYSGQIGKAGFFEVGLNIRGLSFAGEPSGLRVLQWNGKRYEDVTSRLDLVTGMVYARSGILSPLILTNRDLSPSLGSGR
jgi:hypothetical protein